MEDSQKAVSIMEDVKEIFKKQSEHVDNTKQAFDEIQKNVEQSIAGMSAIDDKTKQLDKERSGVIDIVQNLSAIAQENAASTEETSASVTEVKGNIRSVVGRSRQPKEYFSYNGTEYGGIPNLVF